MNNAPVIIRYITTGLIWVGVLILGIFAIIVSDSNTDSAAIPIAITAFITAAIATGFLLNDEIKDGSEKKTTTADSKRKNDQSGFNPIDLLTEDDLDDLRAEVKEQLRQRILSGADGELSSLDELINNAPRAKRK
ncbi:MAG: hypothetical protein MUF38_13205 [Anaerolineae bacterium]|jgi:hypothetical protein|nr:hypothetical protein [Anaerolineae bacterium]